MKKKANTAGIYIIKFDNGCKVGMSVNLKERIRVYKKAWCRPISEEFLLTLPGYADPWLDASALEKAILDRVRTTVTTSEYITDVPFEEIKKIAIEEYKLLRLKIIRRLVKLRVSREFPSMSDFEKEYLTDVYIEDAKSKVGKQ